MQQRDSLAASLAEAKRAGGRAAKYAHAVHAEIEKLRQRSSGEAADRVDAKHTIASLQAQVSPPHVTRSVGQDMTRHEVAAPVLWSRLAQGPVGS